MAVLLKEQENLMQAQDLDTTSFLKAFDPGPPTLCKLCQTEFNLIAIHQKIVHSGNKEKRCAFCAKQFINRKGLLDHLDVHSDGSDLFCCFCLNEQKSDDALSEHVETHRELHVFLCYKCSETFATKSGLSGHDCVPHLKVVGTNLEHIGLSPKPSEVSGEGGAESVRRLVKIGQRQVRMSESTFSDSLGPRVTNCKSPGEQLQDDGNADKASANAARGEGYVIGISSVISLQTPLQDTTNRGLLMDIKSEISPVKVDFDQGRDPIAELNSHSDLSPRHSQKSADASLVSTVNMDAKDPLSLIHDTAGEALLESIPTTADVGLPGTFDVTTPVILPETPPSSLRDPGGDSNILALYPSIKEDPANLCALEVDLQKTSPQPPTPVTPQCAPCGGSNNLAQCPSTAINMDETSPCTTEAELSQQAALPPATTTEKEVPEESHTNPQSPLTTSPSDPSLGKYGRTLRSRKRLIAATCDSVDEKKVTPGIQTKEPAELRLTADSTAPTPPDSPPCAKKKRISFNEQIEYWNPTLRERVWLDITEEFPEVREVPLLKVSKKKSKKKKKKSSKSKNKKSSKKEETPEFDSSSPDRPAGSFPSYGLGTPTTPPKPLRPVLKPSSVLQVEPPSPKPSTELNVKGRCGRLPAQSDQLFEKFGSDFSYMKCLKVDGRFHCPDNDCRDNNDRGFATDKGLRLHLRQYHITAPSFDCSICNKSWTSASKLKQHLLVHNPPDTYSCSICEKKFKTQQAVKNHKLLHSQPFQCFHCQKKFSRKISIKTHLRPMKCDCCEIELRCTGLFRRHEEDVPHLYECTGCEKKCKKLRDFNWHVRNVHYEESTAIDGNWICHVCERKFTTRQIALRHARNNHKTTVKNGIENSDP